MNGLISQLAVVVVGIVGTSVVATFGWFVRAWFSDVRADIAGISTSLGKLVDTDARLERRVTRLESRLELHELVVHAVIPRTGGRRLYDPPEDPDGPTQP